MLEAKALDQGHRRKCFPKKFFFLGDLQKKVFKKFLLVLELRSRGFYVQAYADDLAVQVSGADMLWMRGMAQKAINIAANWASKQELQFNSKKTEIVHSRTESRFGFLVNKWFKTWTFPGSKAVRYYFGQQANLETGASPASRDRGGGGKIKIRGAKVFADLRRLFLAEILTFFSGQKQVISKKKGFF